MLRRYGTQKDTFFCGVLRRRISGKRLKINSRCSASRFRDFHDIEIDDEIFNEIRSSRFRRENCNVVCDRLITWVLKSSDCVITHIIPRVLLSATHARIKKSVESAATSTSRHIPRAWCIDFDHRPMYVHTPRIGMHLSSRKGSWNPI